MATHSSILAWRIPWTEETGWLQSLGSHRVGLGCDWAQMHFIFFNSYLSLIQSKMKALLVLISWLTTPLISVLGSFPREVLGTFNNTFLQVYLVLFVLRPTFQFYFNRQKLSFSLWPQLRAASSVKPPLILSGPSLPSPELPNAPCLPLTGSL